MTTKLCVFSSFCEALVDIPRGGCEELELVRAVQLSDFVVDQLCLLRGCRKQGLQAFGKTRDRLA